MESPKKDLTSAEVVAASKQRTNKRHSLIMNSRSIKINETLIANMKFCDEAGKKGRMEDEISEAKVALIRVRPYLWQKVLVLCV